MFEGEERGLGVVEAQRGGGAAAGAESEGVDGVDAVGEAVEQLPVPVFEAVGGVGFGGGAGGDAELPQVHVFVKTFLEVPGIASVYEDNLVVVGEGRVGGALGGPLDDDVGEPLRSGIVEEGGVGRIVDVDVGDARQLAAVGVVEGQGELVAEELGAQHEDGGVVERQDGVGEYGGSFFHNLHIICEW